MKQELLDEESSVAFSISTPSPTWRLLIASSAALYLEIVLIRWLGTEVKIFAFFQNLTLIVCFLGFGVGCLTHKKGGSVLPTLLATTALTVVAGIPNQSFQMLLRAISTILSMTPDAALWGQQITVPRNVYWQLFGLSLLVVAGFLLLLSIVMIPLGRLVGHYLESAGDTVTAYSINLAGSLVGIWLLALLALFWLPPSCWFTIVFLLVFLCEPFSWRSALATAALLAVTLIALRHAGAEQVYWSPYQKITVADHGDQQYQINVNNEGYMSIANVTPAYLSRYPNFAAEYQESSYDSPFHFAQNTGRVLVVGSGAGNDVAAALRHGAEHVDAVEIDPLISNLGLRLHPEQPYNSPKVHLVNWDARNYMRGCREKYDVIVFGLLDSHTGFSSFSNMRVDNYVYTEDSFREARRLLNPDGILVVKFEVRPPWTWMGQRFYAMLDDVFSHPPVTYYSKPVGGLFSGTVFIESASSHLWEASNTAELAAFVRNHPPSFTLTAENAPPPATDDWPYVYHLSHSIPRTYFCVSAIIVLLAIYFVGPLATPAESSFWQFFLLGCGFLLMETQLVSRLALFFGTTWLVNCIALTGILAVLLVANLYVKYKAPERLGTYYICLCAMLLVDFATPWDRLPGSGTQIGILMCFAYCIPVFFAGIIFTESFRRLAGSRGAFGANMLGAVAGGLAQNLSFIFGMKALLLVAVLVYGAAALLQMLKPLRGLEAA